MADICTKIEDAVAFVNQGTASIDGPYKEALLSRLKLRRVLLSAVQPHGSLELHRAKLWEDCLELLPVISQTNKLGVPPENSFSIKIQRKLASTVPPRPIVKIEFDEALLRLEGICRNARDAYRILQCQTGTRLMVSDFDFWCSTEKFH